MNKELVSIKLLALLVLFSMASCQEDDDILSDISKADTVAALPGSNEQINDWITEHMDLFYYWNTSLPTGLDVKGDPKDYFNDLLYHSDKFSYISDDAKKLAEEFSGTSLAVGYSPAFGKFSGSENVFIMVEYVYPGSSAALQGLKRGDIILKIDGQTLNTSNYYELYKQQGEHTISLGKADGETISDAGVTYTVTPGYINTDPVVHWEIKENSGITIGYLVYVEFLTGDEDVFLESLNDILGEMKTQGVSELIVDLRYNPGGEISAANYLANAIAPQSVTQSKEVFVKFQYNEGLANYYLEKEGDDSDNLAVRFSESPYNLGIDRVVFLTTSGSASASELIINGLEPYMDVVSIGEPTYGKYYGSYVIYDRDKNPAHNYAIMPVVMKYANALGVTDFANGLEPDYLISDNMLEAKPFGDETDPMLARAMEVITGTSDVNARTAFREKTYTSLENKLKLRKGNVMKSVSAPELVN